MDAFMRNDLTIQWNIIPQNDTCIYDETPNCSDDFPNWDQIVGAIWAKKMNVIIIRPLYTPLPPQSVDITFPLQILLSVPFSPNRFVSISIRASLHQTGGKASSQFISVGFKVLLIAIQYRHCQNSINLSLNSLGAVEQLCRRETKVFWRRVENCNLSSAAARRGLGEQSGRGGRNATRDAPINDYTLKQDASGKKAHIASLLVLELKNDVKSKQPKISTISLQ